MLHPTQVSLLWPALPMQQEITQPGMLSALLSLEGPSCHATGVQPPRSPIPLSLRPITLLTSFSFFCFIRESVLLAPQDGVLLLQSEQLPGSLLQLLAQILQLQDQLLFRLLLFAQRLLQLCFLHLESFQKT